MKCVRYMSYKPNNMHVTNLGEPNSRLPNGNKMVAMAYTWHMPYPYFFIYCKNRHVVFE